MLPPDRLAGRVDELTTTIAQRSPLSVAAAKEIIDDRAGPARIAWWHRKVATTGEAREGVAAMAERRTPRFAWRAPADD